MSGVEEEIRDFKECECKARLSFWIGHKRDGNRRINRFTALVYFNPDRYIRDSRSHPKVNLNTNNIYTMAGLRTFDKADIVKLVDKVVCSECGYVMSYLDALATKNKAMELLDVRGPVC